MSGLDQRIITFYPWNLSQTGKWGSGTEEYGLNLLRYKAPQELAELLWEPGRDVQQTAIIEIMAHGNPRKAAEVARELVRLHPAAERSLREDLQEPTTSFLLETPLRNIPSKPEEYPANVIIRYVQ